MHHTYDPLLFGLSILISCLASFTALTLTGHLMRPAARHRPWWQVGGALIFGLGIWSMHFIGMLALHSPVMVQYDVLPTLASLLMAVAASGLALRLAVQPVLRLGHTLLSGLTMGLGISAMHYTGMSALDDAITITYDPAGVALSVLIAIIAATLALYLAFTLRGDARSMPAKRALAALVMGAAISSMHYTAMWAAHMHYPTGYSPHSVDHALAWWVSGAALLLGGLFAFSLATERRFTDQLQTVRDHQTRLEEDVQRGEALYQGVVDALHEGVLVFDQNLRIVTANAAAERFLGWESGCLVGQPATTLLLELKDEDGLPFTLPDDEGRQSVAGRDRLVVSHHRAGQTRWFLGHVRALPQGRTVCSFVDITHERSTHYQLEYRANHDALTGLPNRQRFTGRLRDAARASAAGAARGAVLLLDLDHFKDINDTLGHQMGDALLQQVARRLLQLDPRPACVARFSGDEFVIRLSGYDAATALREAERFRIVLSQPYELAGAQVHISASFGICCYPDDAQDEETLLRCADLALYEAKENGRGQVHLFTPQLRDRQQHRVHLGDALRGAIRRGELALHYQPVVHLATGRIQSCEALLRWQHPVFGFISPAEFIPIAEELGLIGQIGEWVIEQACLQAKAWVDQGRPVRVAVNISPLQFQHGTLPGRVAALLSATGLTPEWLEVEVTEGVMMREQWAVVPQLDALRQSGVSVALDDFGTGYSSLNLLQRLQVDKVKLDRTFVRDLDQPRQAALVGGLIDLCSSLALTVVAEGIETTAQFGLLRDLGCPLGQGYLMSRPVDAPMMADILQRPALLAPELVTIGPPETN